MTNTIIDWREEIQQSTRVTVSNGIQEGGGAEGGGDDHDGGSNASSPNNNGNGAEEEEAAVDNVEDKGEGFAMGLTLICWDDTATMMDTPLPLIARHPLPLWELPL